MKYSNPVRRKIAEGGVILCAMQRLPNPSATEIMAMSGIDMICIDNEHYPFSVNTVERIARAAHIHGASVFMRVPGDDPARIAQMMDCGLQGIKVPHVETRAQAQAIVDAVKYAPIGTRGFCPITRAAAYGLDLPPDEYTKDANQDTLVAIMVETKTGLEHLDEILTVSGVDIIAIGPSDVAASYGLPGQADHPVVRAAIEEGQRKIIHSGKLLCALAKNGEDVKQGMARGVRMFQVGSELQMLSGQLTALLRTIEGSIEDYEK